MLDKDFRVDLKSRILTPFFAYVLCGLCAKHLVWFQMSYDLMLLLTKMQYMCQGEEIYWHPFLGCSKQMCTQFEIRTLVVMPFLKAVFTL